MIDAMTPAPTLTIPASWEHKIADRWLELLPHVRIWLGERTADLSAVQSQHRAWLASLLRHDIEMRVVRRLLLDDIRQPQSVLAARRDKYIEKRHRRKPNSHV